MALVSCRSLYSPLYSPLPSSSAALSSSKTTRTQITASSSPGSSPMDHHGQKLTRLMDFPYVSTSHRNLMVNLISTVENRLGSHLLPCSLPPDVQYFENQTQTARASLHIRPGRKSSPIDFIMGSWIHCELPSGALNITSFSAYLTASTDAPNFLFELIESSPTSLVLILDLPPRKDLVLHPDYLQTFYEDTRLDSHRQTLEKLPEVQPYISSSLFIRCACSPTAIMIRVKMGECGSDRTEKIIKDHIAAAAEEVLGIWVNQCACVERNVGETERGQLEKRDRIFRNRTIEVDLGSSFPRLFGSDIANRVLELMREAFRV